MLILLSLSQVDNSLFIFADVIAANAPLPSTDHDMPLCFCLLATKISLNFFDNIA